MTTTRIRAPIVSSNEAAARQNANANHRFAISMALDAPASAALL
jgi:hypothetical protein